ncbi:MAG: phasin family protein, partial [Deltaproteobacteria bacterium]|nr:phasin family protein [Deltaproteobacteria bacterium]
MKTQTPASNDFNPVEMLKGLSVPGVDVGALIDSQKRNLEALAEATRVSLEGLQAVAKRQEEMLRNAAGEIQAAASELKSPEKYAEFATTIAKKSLDQARELAELVAKANRD